MTPRHTLSQDAARLDTLSEVNEALAGGSILRASLQRVLQLLDRRDSVVCGSITLLNPDAGLLHVEAAEGLTPEGRSARYKVGEGVTGRVVESGKPVIVPRASQEPMFFNRARRKNLDRRDMSFICVPIKTRREPVGAISVDLPFEKELIEDALKTTRGNRVKAARLLQSTERIISYKVKKFAIDCSRYRQ